MCEREGVCVGVSLHELSRCSSQRPEIVFFCGADPKVELSKQRKPLMRRIETSIL